MSDIDREVAEKVTGWKRIQWEEEVWADAHTNRWRPGWVGSRNGIRTMIPPYSTDITHAWEVVEDLASGHGFQIIHYENTYTAIFYERDTNKEDYREGQGRHASAPLAICKAALEVVKAETAEPSTTHPLPTTQENRNE